MDISTIIGGLLLVAVFVVPLIVAIIAFFMLGRIFYKVPGPDEALVITGRGAKLTKEYKEQLEAERRAAESKDTDTSGTIVASKVEPDPEFKIVVGTGSWLKPGQRMERLSLAAQQADVSLRDVPTVQGINLHTSATVLYKVGDTYSAIARAARRFAGNNDWTKMVSDVLEGQLRTVVGTMTVEDIWQNRDALSTKVAEASGDELARLGLQIESFQLKPIEDPSGYIANLAAAPLAEKERDARITRAENEQLAAQREAETQTQTEQALSAAKIAQAQARQEADRIEAEANQAKPLAEAKAKQAVIEEETKNTELEKELNLQRLQATVYQEADAAKYAAVVNAQAQSETAVIQAEAQAKATQIAADVRKDAAAANAEADAVVTERAAQAQAAATEAQAAADARAATLRAEALEAEGRARAAAAEAEGLATAKVTLEQGLAVAEAKRLEAEAMSANQDAVVALEMVRQLPAALAANASAYSRVGQVTVMGGMEDIQEGLSGVLQQGLASLPAILGAVKGSGISSALGAIPAFPAPSFNVGQLVADEETAEKLADKAAMALAKGVEKASKTTAKTAKSSGSDLADVSSAFSKSVVDVDTSLPSKDGQGIDVSDIELGDASVALGQAGEFLSDAQDVAGQASDFVEKNREDIDRLVAAGQRLSKRRTR